MTVKISGFEEVRDALRGMQGRARQNVERKAARASMQKFRREEQVMFRKYPVQKSSVEWNKTKTKTYKSGRTKKVASYSVRRSAAKAVTVKVSTKRNAKAGQWSVRATTFLNYHKKNAGAARFAHLLELGTKLFTGKFRLKGLYRTRRDRMAVSYMRALKVWIMRPKAKAKQVAKVI